MTVPDFRAALESADGESTVVVAGELDAFTGPLLWERLDEAIARGDGTVTVDLRDVSFMDSRGLSVLAQAVRQLGDRPLVLRSPGRTTRKVLEISGLGQLVEITD